MPSPAIIEMRWSGHDETGRREKETRRSLRGKLPFHLLGLHSSAWFDGFLQISLLAPVSRLPSSVYCSPTKCPQLMQSAASPARARPGIQGSGCRTDSGPPSEDKIDRPAGRSRPPQKLHRGMLPLEVMVPDPAQPSYVASGNDGNGSGDELRAQGLERDHIGSAIGLAAPGGGYLEPRCPGGSERWSGPGPSVGQRLGFQLQFRVGVGADQDRGWGSRDSARNRSATSGESMPGQILLHRRTGEAGSRSPRRYQWRASVGWCGKG